jgi:hypothetical protein
MRELLIFPALLVALAGLQCLSDAAAIAIRRKSNVWSSARPEAGAGVCFLILALFMAAVAGGVL